MLSKAVKLVLVAALVAALAVDGATAQNISPAPPATPPATPVTTPQPTVQPIQTDTQTPTPAPPQVHHRNGGGGRRNQTGGSDSGSGLNFGDGGISGGGRSGLGFGIGAAGVALGVGLISAMGRSHTFSGQDSNPLETGPRDTGPDETGQPPIRQIRNRTRPQVDRSVSTTPSPARAGFAVPARTELRYVPGEVLLVIKAGTAAARVKRLETALGLTPLAAARIDLLDAEVRRYGLQPGASVRAAMIALRGRAIVTAAQPNYLFDLQLDAGPPPARAAVPAGAQPNPPSGPAPGPAQYAIDALHLVAAHKLATGTDVRVAIIDSGIDETNPDLKDSVVERFDAVGAPFKVHSHGTAIGGTIVAHHRLVGIAPKGRLIAVRAFAGSSTGADGTSFNILRGVDFAAMHGARIVNMSFAGPRDQLLEAALQAATKRGIICIAAVGNAGPLAKPLYPAAESDVIAVSATDASGKPFARANRGPYIAVAAPGVDIIAPGLGDSVQITSGTSIAAAEASGVVALLLQRRPGATPAEIRAILKATARRLTVEPAAAGAGLIDAQAALAAVK